jgi:hypothetical protein
MSSARDNLVSRDPGSLPTICNTSGVGLGKDDEEVTLADVVRCLVAIEEIVRPMQPVPDNIVAIELTVWE